MGVGAGVGGPLGGTLLGKLWFPWFTYNLSSRLLTGPPHTLRIRSVGPPTPRDRHATVAKWQHCYLHYANELIRASNVTNEPTVAFGSVYIYPQRGLMRHANKGRFVIFELHFRRLQNNITKIGWTCVDMCLCKTNLGCYCRVNGACNERISRNISFRQMQYGKSPKLTLKLLLIVTLTILFSFCVIRN